VTVLGNDEVGALHPVVQYHVANTLGWTALRPLQAQALEPILRDRDTLLLAPTAGGKTEAAVFPLLALMADHEWTGLSVLYVCPLRALLNNLEPRLRSYAGWLGRLAAVWHGDTPAPVRRRLAADPPDILLTTPESIESMLVSTLLDSHRFFADLRTVVVDEVHAFAGDDRGWHLLAVLERLSRIAGRPLQRIGLSATVGNPEFLLRWLQGSGVDNRAAVVVAPDSDGDKRTDLQIDFVGSVDNAATVIASLHRGEKRLAFADSRRTVEQLAAALHERGVKTLVSHSSLSLDERRRAEAAFNEGRDCVIVSTSTLELGIDVGDLDRVIQVGAPSKVSSILQRLGRTGRRPGTRRNGLFLATTDEELLQATALLQLFNEGYVEPVQPPGSPRHVLAQQLLALCLQEGRVGDTTWIEWLGRLPLASPAEVTEITAWLVASGHLDRDSGMLFMGPETERRYGYRHFMELLSVFTVSPEFTVSHGRTELGTVDPVVLTRRVDGPRVLSLAGHPWRVTHVDWKRRRAYVEIADIKGASRWSSAPTPLSYAVTDAMRRVLLGEIPPVTLSRRATQRLEAIRHNMRQTVDSESTVVVRASTAARWWTWAGGRANATLAFALDTAIPNLIDGKDRYDNRYIALTGSITSVNLRRGLSILSRSSGAEFPTDGYSVSGEAVSQLKFAELLPPALAAATLAARAVDAHGARLTVNRRILSV
jgi:ATP-dependent Lhr-like helicase